MMPTRRETLGFFGATGLVAGIGVAACDPKAPHSEKDTAMPDYFSGDALYEDVKHYAALGVHRTGTKVDHQVTDWMASHLDGLGFDVTRLPFQVRQFFPDTVSLKVGDRLLELDKDIGPQWPVTSLPAPLTAPLIDLTDGATSEHAGGIAIIDGHLEPPTSPEAQAALRSAMAHKPAAIIAIGKSETGRIWYGNYHHDTPLFDLPVILAGRKDRDFLKSAAATGTEATLTLTGRVDPDATAYNVIARLDRGTKPAKQIVISTPQSGWTTCAGERGPGISYFRALAQWAATSEEAAAASFVFVCNSGHEIWNHGAHESIKAGLIPGPSDTRFWLHLGANIGVYNYQGLISHGQDGARRSGPINKTYGMAPKPMVPAVSAMFKEAKTQVVDHETFNVGEMEEIVAAGYDPAVGLVGANLWHHIPGDTAETTGPEPLEAMGRGVLALTRSAI